MSGLFRKKVSAPQIENGSELPSLHDPLKIRLGVIVGHTKEAPGAFATNGMNEYQFNTSIAKTMAEHAAHIGGIEVIVIFRDGIGISGAYEKAEEMLCDCVIELHFNAFNKVSTGTLTLCSQSSDDMAFASIIQKAMCKVFGREGMSKGVQVIPRSARGGGNVNSFKGGCNCLVEPFFGDNEMEVNLAMARKDEYAMALVEAVILWAKKIDSKI